MPQDELAMLTAQAQIGRVLARYCQALDDGDLDALGECFTEGAVLEAFGRTRTGRQEATALLAKAMPPERRGTHLTVNTVIGNLRTAPDGSGRATALSDFAFVAPDGTVTTGRYADEFVAVAGTWQISSRQVTLRG